MLLNVFSAGMHLKRQISPTDRIEEVEADGNSLPNRA